MAYKATPGSYTVSTTTAGTPHLRGEARIEGKRVRRKTTFDKISDAYRFKEALDRAASVGDYRWLRDDPDDPWPIDDYLGGPAPAPPTVVTPAPAPAARRAPAGTWTLAQWLEDGGCRDRLLNGHSAAAKANYQALLDAVEDGLGNEELEVLARLKGVQLARKLTRYVVNYGVRRPGSVRPRTVADRLQRLKDVLEDSYDHDAITKYPKIFRDHYKVKSNGKKMAVWLTVEEMKALLEVLRDPHNDVEAVAFALAEVCLFTGLRYGEVAAWRWKETLKGAKDFIAIDWTWSTKDGGFLARETKNDGEWQIPYTKQLAAVMKRVPKRRGIDFVFAVHPDDSKVEDKNRPILYSRWRKLLQEAADRAGITLPKDHSQKIFRKSFVVWGKVCGVRLGFMQAQYGHRTTRMIQQIYDGQIHWGTIPDEQERAEMRKLLGFDQLEKKRRIIAFDPADSAS